MVRALSSKCTSLIIIHFPFLFYISIVHTYRRLKITRAKDIDWNNTEKMGNYLQKTAPQNTSILLQRTPIPKLSLIHTSISLQQEPTFLTSSFRTRKKAKSFSLTALGCLFSSCYSFGVTP